MNDTRQALPRLIACDLDGTFLSPDGTISEVNRNAVARARQAGISVIFATGRPPRWLGLLRELGVGERRVICSNGALIFDLDQSRPLLQRPIPSDLAHAVITTVRAGLPGAAFAVEMGMTFGVEPAYARNLKDDRSEPLAIAAAEVLIDQGPVIKLLVQHGDLGADDLLRRAQALLGDRVTVTHSAFGNAGLLELSAAGVSKASTLAHYCRTQGIAADEVAAFGDMPNDAAMLTWAGRPYVMADAHPSLVATGAQQIGSNAESAVGQTILSWLT